MITPTIYPQALLRIVNATIDADSHRLKLALLDSTATFDDTDEVFADVSADEISGTGYTAGGKVITVQTVSIVDGAAELTASDTVWENATLTAHHAVIYDDSVATKPLIGHLNLGGAESAVAQDFAIEWPDGVLLTLSEAA